MNFWELGQKTRRLWINLQGYLHGLSGFGRVTLLLAGTGTMFALYNAFIQANSGYFPSTNECSNSLSLKLYHGSNPLRCYASVGISFIESAADAIWRFLVSLVGGLFVVAALAAMLFVGRWVIQGFRKHPRETS